MVSDARRLTGILLYGVELLAVTPVLLPTNHWSWYRKLTASVNKNTSGNDICMLFLIDGGFLFCFGVKRSMAVIALVSYKWMYMFGTG